MTSRNDSHVPTRKTALIDAMSVRQLACAVADYVEQTSLEFDRRCPEASPDTPPFLNLWDIERRMGQARGERWSDSDDWSHAEWKEALTVHARNQRVEALGSLDLSRAATRPPRVLLHQFVHAANSTLAAKAGLSKQVFRVATGTDKHVEFSQLLTRSLHGHEVLVLRPLSGDQTLVLAFASDCRSTGRTTRFSPPAELARPPHARSRSRGIER